MGISGPKKRYRNMFRAIFDWDVQGNLGFKKRPYVDQYSSLRYLKSPLISLTVALGQNAEKTFVLRDEYPQLPAIFAM